MIGCIRTYVQDRWPLTSIRLRLASEVIAPIRLLARYGESSRSTSGRHAMAGQTPEPSFQPAGQDSGLTQGRPAWQAPPSYTPPAGTGGGQAYAAPAPSYSLQDQPSYNPQDQGYQAHDQTQT